MTLDEALSAAILGDRVRAVDMPEGVYVDYHFQGWRKNFPSGSSSGFIPMAHDATVAWEVVAPPERKPAVGKWGTGVVPKAPEPPVLVQTGDGWGAAPKPAKVDKRPEPNQPADADRRWGKLIAGTPSPSKPATDKWGRKL